MLNLNYAYKSERVDNINNGTIYTYQDCFTDKNVTVEADIDDIMADLHFEVKQHIIFDGEYISGDISKHIIRLMRPRTDDMEFTDLNIYLTVDGVVSCNIDLSTRYLTVTDIDNFVRTLEISTENTGLCELMLGFSRPDINIDTFTIKKSY